MAKGRKPKYETHVEPFLEDISKWKPYHTEEQIAEMLGIAYSTLQTYKAKYKELDDVLRFGNKKKIDVAESALMKLAEDRIVTTHKGVLDKDGNIIMLPVENHYPPSLKAVLEILKRYDPYYHSEDAYISKRQDEKLIIDKNKDKREEEDHW